MRRPPQFAQCIGDGWVQRDTRFPGSLRSAQQCAFENVELPLLLTRLNRSQRRRQVETALELVGLSDRARHLPRQLSGGQEQRAAIARALVTDPAIIVADEPTGNLDSQSAHDVLSVLQSLSKQAGKTVIMVTHDPKAAAFGSRTIHLEKGELLGA